MKLMRSIMAVGIGLLLALVLGLLVVQGIFAPVLTRLFGLERAGPATLPLVLLVFAAAFSFYFGGMAASYKAPSRHRLHGVLVVPVAFVLSLAINLVLGKGFLPGVDGAWAVGLVAIFLIVSCAASYVGAIRGEALYAHNQTFARRRRH
jgi:O-antigen/teichoic acid export membrane protein